MLMLIVCLLDFLVQKLEEEQSEQTFSALPFAYMEIGHLLLDG